PALFDRPPLSRAGEVERLERLVERLDDGPLGAEPGGGGEAVLVVQSPDRAAHRLGVGTAPFGSGPAPVGAAVGGGDDDPAVADGPAPAGVGEPDAAQGVVPSLELVGHATGLRAPARA